MNPPHRVRMPRQRTETRLDAFSPRSLISSLPLGKALLKRLGWLAWPNQGEPELSSSYIECTNKPHYNYSMNRRGLK